MADVYTRIGYIKGATGATGAQGEKGDTGDAATIQVGSVTTVPYGQTANVTNSGTEQAAVFDFTIPQGRPGQQVTEMDNLLLNSITTSAAEFPLPAVGETGKVLWGKVVKWFSDMSVLVATKLNVANVVNNLTTTASGYALDARQGKALYDDIAHLGTSYTASWIATSSSAANVQLTSTLDMLPKGIYLITGSVPITNTANNALELSGTNVDIRANSFYSSATYTHICEFVKVTGTPMRLLLITKASTQTTYSNIERGYLQATRLDATF